MSHHLLLIIPLLSATVWVGGHLLLTFGHLPQGSERERSEPHFELRKKYEPVGMPTLILLVITAILMAYNMVSASKIGSTLLLQWRKWLLQNYFYCY